MRLTVTVPDPIADDARRLAEASGQSVSSLVAEAVEAYIQALRRRQAAERVGALIGRTPVAPDADEALRAMRRASDRSFSDPGPDDA